MLLVQAEPVRAGAENAPLVVCQTVISLLKSGQKEHTAVTPFFSSIVNITRVSGAAHRMNTFL